MTQAATEQEQQTQETASGNMPALSTQQNTELAASDIGGNDFGNLLHAEKFNHMWRVASLFGKSKMVPAQYQGQTENCFIACQMAVRLGVDPFMFMQNTYIVHGRPGMEAKLAIALVNSSGLFRDSLDYEIEGDDASEQGYRVRAFAVRKSTGKQVNGPWIDWMLVKAEGWDKTNGSKWKTMPALMFQYRAATFFARLHCPERLMGMQTVDEAEDVGERRYVESTSQPPAPGRHKLGAEPEPREPFDAEQAQGGSDAHPGTEPTDDPGADHEQPEPPEEDAPAEPQAEPASAKRGSGEPTAHDLLVDQLAGKLDITADEAAKRLDRYTHEQGWGSFADIKLSKVTEISGLVSKGEFPQ